MISKELKNQIKQMFISKYADILKDNVLKQKNTIKKNLGLLIEGLITNQKTPLSLSDKEKEVLIEEIINDFLGFGPLNSLLSDPEITEIMVNGPSKVFVERRGKTELTDITFEDETHLMHIIYNMLKPVRRRVDESSPYVDIMLSDNSRVNIVLSPISLQGPLITIRKFLSNIKTIEDLIKLGSLNEKMGKFLIAAINAKLNIVFSGATGAGKTTTLNVLSRYIPSCERIITIEDTAELVLSQDHVVRLEARPANIEGKGEISMRDLFRNSLRMRPNRIILGEVRGKEALDLLQAVSSGHSGSLAVVHASSPEDVIQRLEVMVVTTSITVPLWIVRRQISTGIDLIVQIEQLSDGSRKITRLTEVGEIHGEEILLQDIFFFKQEGIEKDGKIRGRFHCSGIKPRLHNKLQKANIDLPESLFEKD